MVGAQGAAKASPKAQVAGKRAGDLDAGAASKRGGGDAPASEAKGQSVRAHESDSEIDRKNRRKKETEKDASVRT